MNDLNVLVKEAGGCVRLSILDASPESFKDLLDYEELGKDNHNALLMLNDEDEPFIKICSFNNAYSTDSPYEEILREIVQLDTSLTLRLKDYLKNLLRIKRVQKRNSLGLGDSIIKLNHKYTNKLINRPFKTN